MVGVCGRPENSIIRFYFRVATRIALRIKELQNLPAVMNEELKTKAMMELRALRLLNFQRQVKLLNIAA